MRDAHYLTCEQDSDELPYHVNSFIDIYDSFCDVTMDSVVSSPSLTLSHALQGQ